MNNRKMTVVNSINTILNKLGVSIVRFPRVDVRRRMKMLKAHNIDMIIDVGANIGGYTQELIKLGYKGSIISFEPISEVFLLLDQKSKHMKNWSAYKLALGDFDGENEINVSGNVNSSSLLGMLPKHQESAPHSKYIRKEKIMVSKLDSIFNSFHKESHKVFMKIDVQGYEMAVLKGAEESLKSINGLQIELSLEPLYDKSISFMEMIQFVESLGFELFSLENGFSDPKNGKLLQCDGIFFRKNIH